LSLSYTVSSLHFTAFAAGILIVGLFGHLLIKRTGRTRALWIGAFGISLSTILLVLGQSPYVTISASFLMGTVGSLILAVIPSALSDQYGETRAVALSEANVVSSFFSSLAPILVGWFVLLLGSWRWALVIIALAPIFMAWGFSKTKAPDPHPSQNEPLSSGQALPTLYWIYWAAIVAAVSIEFCMIYWSADYLEKNLGMLKVDAAQAVSLFLGAMIIGRWGGSRLVQRFRPRQIVIASVLVAAAGFSLYWLGVTPIMGLIGLFICGLGVACMYPMILSMAIGVADGLSIQASARATLASGTAILVLPLVLGRLADAVGIHQAYGIVALLLLSVFLIIFLASRRDMQPATRTE